MTHFERFETLSSVNNIVWWSDYPITQDEGVAEAEYQETLKEKVRTLEAYMVEIAQTVIKDAEQSAGEGETKTPSAFRYAKTCHPGLILCLSYPPASSFTRG